MQNANEEVITFFVRLCGDVLVEVLCFAERRRLTKFERIGRRFHLISKNFFAEIPFLRLSLEFKPGYLFSLLGARAPIADEADKCNFSLRIFHHSHSHSQS